MKKLAVFQTIEQFWHIYNHLIRPNTFTVTTDYHLFKDGIKPTWEDPANQKGGKWMVRLKKGLASRYWEDLILAIIGEQFDVGQEICGAVVSVRNNEDIISIWNRNADNEDASFKIRDQIRRILRLPPFISVEYKKHQDSLVDKSSFRNPSIVYRPNKPNNDANRGNLNNRDPNKNNAFIGYHGTRNSNEGGWSGNSNRQGTDNNWNKRSDGSNWSKRDNNGNNTGNNPGWSGTASSSDPIPFSMRPKPSAQHSTLPTTNESKPW